MTSWRESLSEEAQADLDELLEPGITLAETFLGKRREFAPFGVGTSVDGPIQIYHLAENRGVEDGSILVRWCEEMLRDSRDSVRSCALVLDTRIPSINSDAIEMRLEHRDGAALRIHIPYSFVGLRKRLVLGEMMVGEGTPRIWADA